MSKNPNIEAFDSEAEVLERLYPSEDTGYVEEMRPFLSQLELSETDTGTVVELGCGLGNLTQALLEIFPKANVLGVDGSARLVDNARRRVGVDRRVSFIVSPFEDLKWQALPQDCAAVVAVYALEHIPPEERCRMYRGICGILRDGGVFLDKEWARDTTRPGADPRDRSRLEHTPDFIRRAIAEGRITVEEHWRLWDKLAQPKDHCFMDLEEQQAALNAAGFREVGGEWITAAITVVRARR